MNRSDIKGCAGAGARGVWRHFLGEMRRLWRDEEGAVFTLVVVVFLALSVTCFGVAGIGDAIRQKVEMQNAVDAAAYSGAVVQADIFSACAQINQAVAWHYGSLLSATIEYINAKWLRHLRRIADTTYEVESVCDNCGKRFEWSMTTPYGVGSRKTWGSAKNFEGALRADLGIAGQEEPLTDVALWLRMERAKHGGGGQLGIHATRDAIAKLCEVERELKQNATAMIRAEVHDVLRKNLDLPSVHWGGIDEECFFACDMDTGDDDEYWFRRITLRGGDDDTAWKHITGQFWGSTFMTGSGRSDETMRWVLGLAIPATNQVGGVAEILNPDYWYRTGGGDEFPGRYNSSAWYPEESPQEHWYLRACIKYEKVGEHGTPGRCISHWVEEDVTDNVGASRYFDEYYNLKDFFVGDKEFTWYRRHPEYFRVGSINVGVVRRMRNLLAMFDDGTGRSIFRVFDPSFWVVGGNRFMMTMASARAGYADIYDGGQTGADAYGLYNPTGDSNYAVEQGLGDRHKEKWREEGWAEWNRGYNGFWTDWDAVLMPVTRARSWRMPNPEAGRSGEWEDFATEGTGHEVLQRLFEDARWYAVAADVSLSEARLTPSYIGLGNLPTIASDFRAPLGWTAATRDALMDNMRSPDPLDGWSSEVQGQPLDISDAQKENVHNVLRH